MKYSALEKKLSIKNPSWINYKYCRLCKFWKEDVITERNRYFIIKRRLLDKKKVVARTKYPIKERRSMLQSRWEKYAAASIDSSRTPHLLIKKYILHTVILYDPREFVYL